MADSNMGKRPLVNPSEFRGGGKSGGGGLSKMDTAAKIKAGASIAAIVVAIIFLAFYFGAFGGGDDAVVREFAEPQLTPEEIQEIEEIHREELEIMERRGTPAVGS